MSLVFADVLESLVFVVTAKSSFVSIDTRIFSLEVDVGLLHIADVLLEPENFTSM